MFDSFFRNRFWPKTYQTSTSRMAGVVELAVPLLTEVGVGSNWDEAH